jgi:apoptosis-inducing factor 2
VLNNKNPAVVKLLPMDVLVCAVGRSRGVGRLGSFKVWSFMVHQMKGKTLGIQMLPAALNGTNY